MQSIERTEELHTYHETVYDHHSEITGMAISEIAEMLSIYFDEINTVAKNLEKTDSLMPKKDIANLLNSLLDYAKNGKELAAIFNDKVAEFAVAKEADLNTI